MNTGLKAFDGFFRRVKRGEKAGYPRFKGKARFDSVLWPKDGDGARWLPDVNRVYLQGIGQVKAEVLALRYAQSLRPCEKDEWVDPIWADGGAVVDLDRRRLLFFGEELMVEVPERRAMMGVLAEVWRDYAICWAYDGTAELAGYVGAELPPHTWDKQPKLRLAWDRNALCHLISVVDTEGQLRMWPVWWHLSKAWHGPALLDKLPGRGVRRLTHGKIPEGGFISTCRESRWERGKPPTQWGSSQHFPTYGVVGRPNAGRMGSRSR